MCRRCASTERTFSGNRASPSSQGACEANVRASAPTHTHSRRRAMNTPASVPSLPPMIHRGACVLVVVIAACAPAPAVGPPVATRGQPRAPALPVAQLQHQPCVGEKHDDLVVAADGQCVCYEPRWEGGVPRPGDREREHRRDFDGLFLCRQTPGKAPLRGRDARHCPLQQPVASEPCSEQEALLRGGDCLYVLPDMKQIVHARCQGTAWREVPDAEVEAERLSRP